MGEQRTEEKRHFLAKRHAIARLAGKWGPNKFPSHPISIHPNFAFAFHFSKKKLGQLDGEQTGPSPLWPRPHSLLNWGGGGHGNFGGWRTEQNSRSVRDGGWGRGRKKNK